MASRRAFIRHAGFALLPLAVISRGRQDPLTKQVRPAANPAGELPADTLALPVGRASARLGPLDNNPGVIAIERRLRCSCGCTLDVYTCRTTDFSCTYSPGMHAKVVAQVQGGATADQVLQWFVSQPEYGEKVLMAPAASGFNLMGYLVPGLTVTGVGLALVLWLVRRSRQAEGVAVAPAGRPLEPGSAGAEQMAELRRALDDVDS